MWSIDDVCNIRDTSWWLDQHAGYTICWWRSCDGIESSRAATKWSHELRLFFSSLMMFNDLTQFSASALNTHTYIPTLPRGDCQCIAPKRGRLWKVGTVKHKHGFSTKSDPDVRLCSWSERFIFRLVICLLCLVLMLNRRLTTYITTRWQKSLFWTSRSRFASLSSSAFAGVQELRSHGFCFTVTLIKCNSIRRI